MSIVKQGGKYGNSGRRTSPGLEQAMGVEPTLSAWKADVLAVIRRLRVWEREAVLTGLLGGEGSYKERPHSPAGPAPQSQRGFPVFPGCHSKIESEGAAAKS